MISPQQVIALAPDAASAKAGEALAAARKWLSVGRDERALWGLLQGSGKQPYQAKVALADFTSSCSCPSRKFPCKHGLGLLFLLARSPADVPAAAAPEFVEEWLGKRADKVAKKANEAAAVERDDPAAEAKAAVAAAKREATREKRVQEGLQDLRLWLLDLAREGFTTHNLQKAEVWEQRARRLNDAQLPGLARRLQELGHIAVTNSDWLPQVSAGIGQLYLALRAYATHDTLSEPEQHDLLRFLGSAQRESDIAADTHVTDTWLCLGEAIEHDDRLTTRRSWLRGRNSGRLAMLLSFAIGNQPLPAAVQAYQSYALTLGFYPSHAPLRATIIAGDLMPVPDRIAPIGSDIAATLRDAAERVGADPWTRLFPVCINARLGRDETGQWWLAEAHGAAMPALSSHSMYEWLARTTGAEAIWFGEWDGRRLRLLSAWRGC